MSEPSVKGSLVAPAVQELLELESQGRIQRTDLERDLKPEDLEMLEADILVSAWYPIASYSRVLEAIGRGHGRSDDDYFAETGRESARRLVEVGLYRQLDARSEEGWEERVGRMMLSLASALWNFGEWEWLDMDQTGFHIRFLGARPMSDIYAHRTRGFIEYLATRAAGRTVRLQMSRSHDGDTLEFRGHREL